LTRGGRERGASRVFFITRSFLIERRSQKQRKKRKKERVQTHPHYYTLFNMVNAPRTVKDTPANEFVISLAQYFRSSGKVRR